VMTRRPHMPSSIQLEILYRSAYVCAICQKRNVQVHHIDKNNANNHVTNLIVLCQEHHGEAHTTRDLTITLTRSRLSVIKRQWEQDVETRRLNAITIDGQRSGRHEFMQVGLMWGYINHSRIANILSPNLLRGIDQGLLQFCMNRGLIDENGIMLVPERRHEPDDIFDGSLYRSYQFGDDLRVHRLYSELVDLIARSSNLIHVDDHSFTKNWVKNFIRPGAFIFVNRGHYFREMSSKRDNEVRLAYTQRRAVKYRYIIETKDMFGNSAIAVTFTGHKRAAAIAIVKSIDASDGLVVECTPVALGIGFQPLQFENLEISDNLIDANESDWQP
jgi:hypothetical protein